MKRSVTDPSWDRDVTPPVRRRTRLARQTLCRVAIHRWYYFIDGSVCRACVRCPRVQYDLSAVRR